jgi:hypothetical protein
MENKFSWFANHNVEAEVVGCGAPLHSLLVEDHYPGDKSCIKGKIAYQDLFIQKLV